MNCMLKLCNIIIRPLKHASLSRNSLNEILLKPETEFQFNGIWFDLSPNVNSMEKEQHYIDPDWWVRKGLLNLNFSPPNQSLKTPEIILVLNSVKAYPRNCSSYYLKCFLLKRNWQQKVWTKATSRQCWQPSKKWGNYRGLCLNHTSLETLDGLKNFHLKSNERKAISTYFE